MLKKASALFSIICLLVLSGCFNVYQHLSSGKNGSVDIYTQLTVSKVILEMANNMSNEGHPIDYDEWLSENTSNDFDKLSEKIKVDSGRINNNLDIGMFYRASINYNDRKIINLKNDPDIAFFPIIENGKITIRTSFSSQDEANQQSNDMANAFLSTAKYTITIDKDILPNIKVAKVVNDTEEINLSIIDSNDEYLIDIPLILIMSGNSIVSIE